MEVDRKWKRLEKKEKENDELEKKGSRIKEREINKRWLRMNENNGDEKK